MAELETDRLRLRQWREADFPAFAALNADRRVMEYMPKLLTRAESDTMAERCREHPDVRDGVHALRRDRLASGLRSVGPWLRHGGCRRRDPLRVRHSRPR